MQIDHRPSPSGGIFKLTLYGKSQGERHFLLKLNEALHAGRVTVRTEDGREFICAKGHTET